MTSKLLALLGYDEDDPEVVAGRKHSAIIARLIESLVSLRDARGLKQSDVAKRMRTTQSTISNFERVAGDPKISTVLRYADAVVADVGFVVQPRLTRPEHLTARAARTALSGRDAFVVVASTSSTRSLKVAAG